MILNGDYDSDESGDYDSDELNSQAENRRGGERPQHKKNTVNFVPKTFVRS